MRDLNKRKTVQHSYTRISQTVKMSIPSKLIEIFKEIPIQIPV